jgi:hypothetical protein
MIRNLKALGLALVAVFAMGALTASAASAQGKLTASGPVTLTGTQTGAEGSNALTAFGAKTECASATYTGHKVATTPHESIPSGATQATITPHYGSCVADGFPATVAMNGCDYVFDLGATTGGVAGTYGVGATVVCPVGKNIEVKAYSSGSHSSLVCTVKILHKATQYTGLHATNGTGGHVNVAGTITGIEAHKTGICLFGATQTTKTAELHLDITVKGGLAVSLSD